MFEECGEVVGGWWLGGWSSGCPGGWTRGCWRLKEGRKEAARASRVGAEKWREKEALMLCESFYLAENEATYLAEN